MYNFRTDLALERTEIYKKVNNIQSEIDGIKQEKNTLNKDIEMTKVEILNENGEKILEKKKGVYITFDIKNFKIAQEEEIQSAAEELSKELKKLVDQKVNSNEEVLIVGLGNEKVTPDALGPNVVSGIEVTRHLLKYVPQYVKPGTRPISALAPGVLGTTGMETLEIIKGVVNNVKPKLLIVIDALSARNISRISSSIQISDTGIVPGSGVGNTREELSEKTLGIPVIAIGIPTVVEAAVITNECLNLFIEKLQSEAKSNVYLNKLKEEDNYEEIRAALLPNDYNFVVTPKEIDELISNMSNVVARGINMSV